MMMKLKAAIVCLIIFVISCHKEIDPPVAILEVPTGEIKAGVPVTFKNNSTNATSAVWDFGDTSTVVTSSATEVAHTFKSHGTFEVKLIATNGDGSSGTSKSVTVKPSADPIIKAKFEISPSAECTVPCKLTLTNSSVNAKTFLWDFGNGTTSTSSAKQIEVTYDKAGTYNIKLTASGDGPGDELIIAVKVNEKQVLDPVANFAVSGDGCVGSCEVSFENKSEHAETHLWNFGDGVLATEASPKHQYRAPGAYLVILVEKNGAKTHKTSKVVHVYPKCIMTKQTREHPVTGHFEGVFDYNDDFLTQAVETEQSSEVKQNLTYQDGYLKGRTSSIKVRNNNNQLVDQTSGTIQYTYNGDGLLASQEVITVKLIDINNPAAGTTTSRSVTKYEYHPNFILSKVDADGIIFNYSDAGAIVSITPAANNPSELYLIDDNGARKTYRVVKYNLRDGRIARIDYADGAYQDWSYDGSGQLIGKTFNAPDMSIVDFEEWTFDNQKNISSLNRVFLGHPSYSSTQGTIANNILTHSTYRVKSGVSTRRKYLTNVEFSEYTANGYPAKSNLFGGDNTYFYKCR
jgi:YD repeat-containing protein